MHLQRVRRWTHDIKRLTGLLCGPCVGPDGISGVGECGFADERPVSCACERDGAAAGGKVTLMQSMCRPPRVPWVPSVTEHRAACAGPAEPHLHRTATQQPRTVAVPHSAVRSASAAARQEPKRSPIEISRARALTKALWLWAQGIQTYDLIGALRVAAEMQ